MQPNITNDDELAAQAVGFLNEFLNVFTELKGKNFYITGESYAGEKSDSLPEQSYCRACPSRDLGH